MPRFLAALLTIAIGAAVLSTGAPARADHRERDWMPLVGTFTLWCTWGNPGGGPPGAGVCDRPGDEHHEPDRPALDIATDLGEPVYAAADGVVVRADGGCAVDDSYGCNNGAGNWVVIDHGDYRSRYLHLSTIDVSLGPVGAGQLIGTAGNSGSTAFAHLHFDEVADNTVSSRIDPESILACHGGQVVSYPEILGVSSWADAPYGSTIRNDGYECLGGPTVGAAAAAVAEVPSTLVPVDPVRVFDTRDGVEPSGRLAPGASLDVTIGENVGIPAGATAVVLNLTATDATNAGFVTAWPTGQARPLASSLNLAGPGDTVANLVIVPRGVGGRVSFYSQSGAHLLADLAGYLVPAPTAVRGGRVIPIEPARLFDTRDDQFPTGALGTDTSIDVVIAGRAGIPSQGVAAVIMTLTATDSASPGYVTAWPAGRPRPLASNLNVTARADTVPNLVVVPLGENGAVSFHRQSEGHLVADVTAYVTDGSAEASTAGQIVPRPASRLFDTRTATTPAGFVDAGSQVSVPAAMGAPSGATAVVLNVTATEAQGPGFITVWPSGRPQPLASTSNLAARDDTRATATLMRLGDEGRVSFFTQSGAHLLADVLGYVTG